ncbi:cupin domain-containing protein [Pseudoduganella lutea]|uniref:Cupin domain-containing protein n=1 Tax=Pseudoduganella lutea TaxID=321985 RepID=A0A4P6L7L7_9BURK|nr:cupin domain-containing protein [Pseudoduganella lutea]QBE66932.1 cupin domain-containing protein [Pseudoduganella lutea]
MNTIPLAINAPDAAPRTKPSLLPAPFSEMMAGRVKQPLGDIFGLGNFGINRCTLAPGSISGLLHQHGRQDEFVYLLAGVAVLVTDEGEMVLTPGMCAGFKAGGRAHRLENRSAEPVVFLEIGDRAAGDTVAYPRDDLAAVFENGAWRFTRKDGSPY